MNIPSFVHIDDGLGFKRTKEEARSSSREGQGGFMSVGVSYLRCQVPVEELEFWVNRLEEFSGQLIRHSAEVLEYYVCSDRGEHQIGGRVCKKGTEQVHKRTGLPQIGARGFRDLSVNTGQWGVSILMLSLETGLRMGVSFILH